METLDSFLNFYITGPREKFTENFKNVQTVMIGMDNESSMTFLKGLWTRLHKNKKFQHVTGNVPTTFPNIGKKNKELLLIQVPHGYPHHNKIILFMDHSLSKLETTLFVHDTIDWRTVPNHNNVVVSVKSLTDANLDHDSEFHDHVTDMIRNINDWKLENRKEYNKYYGCVLEGGPRPEIKTEHDLREFSKDYNPFEYLQNFQEKFRDFREGKNCTQICATLYTLASALNVLYVEKKPLTQDNIMKSAYHERVVFGTYKPFLDFVNQTLERDFFEFMPSGYASESEFMIMINNLVTGLLHAADRFMTKLIQEKFDHVFVTSDMDNWKSMVIDGTPLMSPPHSVILRQSHRSKLYDIVEAGLPRTYPLPYEESLRRDRELYGCMED
ncbi:hypothetical protein [Salmon gill poxvirus]